MDELANLHFNKLDDLKTLYVNVKECILLAENFDPDHSVYLSPVNELRNTLDHIMRGFTKSDAIDIDEEYHEAKEHLFRAGYDAYEVLSLNISDKIVKIVEMYPTEIVSLVFPYYYTEIKKKLVVMKVELANVRSKKKTHSEVGVANFEPYKCKILELIGYLQVCEENIPSLQNEKRRKANNFLKNSFWGIIIGLAIGVGGLYIYDNYFKTESNKISNHQVSTPNIKK